MKLRSILALLILVVLFSPTIYAKNILYIQSAKANILDKPSFSGKSIAKIFKGKTVEVVAKKPNWVKIRSNKHLGWVAAMLVAPTPPLSQKSLFEKLKQSSSEKKTNKVRTRASMQATAAATRGLRDRAASGNEIKTNHKDVLAVESQQVTKQDAWNFHKILLHSK